MEELAGCFAEVVPVIGAVAVSWLGLMVRMGIVDTVGAWSLHALAADGEGRA